MNNFFLKNEYFPKFSKDLCSISGGQDSMFLFFLLLHLKNQRNFKLHFLYCNHLWQISNFHSFKQIYKLAYFFESSLSIVIAEKFIKNELDARIWRKFCYLRISNLEHCSRFLLGHTATDYLETAFFNLIRGASPQGLCGFRNTKKLIIPHYINAFSVILFAYFSNKNKLNKCYKKHIFYQKKIIKKNKNKIIPHFYAFNSNLLFFDNFFICNSFFFNYLFFLFFSYYLQIKLKDFCILSRPILKYHRNDILKLIKFYAIPIITDYSNNDLKFSRNKIRHLIFAKFRTLSNSVFDYKFYQFLDILLQEQNDINIKMKKIFKRFKNYEKLKFIKLSNAEQRRFLYIIFESYKKIKCNFNQIEYIRSLILAQ